MEQTEENVQNEQLQNKNAFNPLVLGGIGIVILVAVFGIFLSQKSSQNKQNVLTASSENISQAGSDTQNSPQTSDQFDNISPTQESDVKIVKVEAGSYYYKPNVIRVKKGQKVKIELTAVDMRHDFNIDELEVRVPITPEGKTSTVEFTADRVGEFEYYCSVANHRQMGQVGKLIVEE